MGALLKIVGGAWGIIGLGNVALMPWATSSQGFMMVGVIFNMVCFMLPGLVLLGIGAGISKKNEAPEKT